MSVDFQQVREQVKQLGENAPRRAERLRDLRQQALDQLHNQTLDLVDLHRRVCRVASEYDASLRCALPRIEAGQPVERLDACHPAPPLPPEATVLAADGSQIAPDRHAEVNYCLINLGAIQMRLGAPSAPGVSIQSKLMYDEELYTPTGQITDARLALMRDLYERRRLAELAERAPPPVITFTDGPMELWGARDGDQELDFKRSLEEYAQVLEHLQALGVSTAGYVDKPGSTLVVRLLEVAQTSSEADLRNIRHYFPLRGVMDIDLFRRLLGPGERSTVFAIQFRSQASYPGGLALHFFYLNVGRPGHPWLARVEIPAWVARNPQMLANLHAVLVDQCRIMGNRPFPYALHRAHEAAVVSLEERDQVTQMIALELRQRGVELGEASYKQSAKDLPGRTRYER
jgi:hypothetical protein